MGAELTKAKIAVMAAVPYIQKTRSQGVSFTFASEAALIDKLQPAMRANGLEICPLRYVMVLNESWENKNGTKMNRVILRATFLLSHVSGESQQIGTMGEGSDSSDKAVNKAMTAAYKYALRQAFLIETGNDPDASPNPDERKPAAQSQQARPPKPKPAPTPNAQAEPTQTSPPPINTMAELAARLATRKPTSPAALVEAIRWTADQIARLTGRDRDFIRDDLVTAVGEAMGCGQSWKVTGLDESHVRLGYPAIIAYVAHDPDAKKLPGMADGKPPVDTSPISR